MALEAKHKKYVILQKITEFIVFYRFYRYLPFLSKKFFVGFGVFLGVSLGL